MIENGNINNNQVGREEEPMIQIADLWRMIWGYKWWYVASAVICLAFAIFYLYRTPLTYVRTAKVMVDESDQDATMRNLGVASAGMMRLRSFNSVENEIEAFASPDLMQTVVERLGLEVSYVSQQVLRNVELYRNSPVEMRLAGGNPQSSFSFLVTPQDENTVILYDFRIADQRISDPVEAHYGDTIQTPVGSVVLYKTADMKSFRHDIRISWANSMARAKGYCGRLSISLSGKESSVLVLSMQDEYPARSTAILNSLIDVYNEEWIRNKNRSAINTAEFINERLVVIEEELHTVEDALKNYKASNNLTDIKAVAQTYLDESSLYATKAFEVNNQLAIARYIKNHLNDPENSDKLIPSNLGLTSASVESQIGEYNDILLQKDRLSNGSGSNNPLIADMTASLEAIRSAILRSVENLIASLELQSEKIGSQEKQILSRMSSNSGQELKLLSIERQQQMIQSLYMFLLQKREENELAALVNVGNTRVIMKPNGSSNPVSPNKMLILFAALVLGCGIPFVIIFLMRVLDTTIKNKEDLGENLSMPFLVEIPLYLQKKRPFGVVRRSDRFNNDNCKIIVQQGKRNMMNEAFRVFRTNIDLVIQKQPGTAHVSMFTSFNPNAGKTFTLMNIAASMALKDSKVLILDLDLRKASLSKALDKEHRGVAAYLNGKVNDYHELIDQVQDGLYVLPVGKLPPNPTELLLTDRFHQMMENLRKDRYSCRCRHYNKGGRHDHLRSPRRTSRQEGCPCPGVSLQIR